MKKNLTTRLFALMLCICMVMGMATTAFADDIANSTIDETKTGSLTIYKYDLTRATNDGVWDSSYVSTGVLDQEDVNDVLGGGNSNTLGNGETSNGYALAGVEFTYVKVADIVQYSENGEVIVLYAVEDDIFLTTIGLGVDDVYADIDNDYYYFSSETLNNALASFLEADTTTAKNTLENYIKNGLAYEDPVTMDLTDEDGMTTATDLPLGLYLVVETAVPEMVTNTTNPFLVSLPMTSVDGNNIDNGGWKWLYDVTVYPKNETGIPTLEKALKESAKSNGKTETYAHTGTASAGDVIDYKLVSKLPGITSAATYLTEYSFVDSLSAGLSYNKNDVIVEFFSDEACTNSIAKWTEADEKFTVSYTTGDEDASVMSIVMTEEGLTEINTSNAVYTAENAVQSGYSNCYVQITYAATMNSDASVALGEVGNPNEVVLTWKRTSSEYYDTLVDDAHVHSFGINLTKLFSDGKGDFANVEFVITNATDNCYVHATYNEDEGVYYVDYMIKVPYEDEATHFVPNDSGEIIIRGLEDDTYILTEVKTDNGYTLLEDTIEVIITAAESTTECDIYTTDVLGLMQNDPRFSDVTADDLANLPQQALKHYLLTASATIDGNTVTMLEDNIYDSANAIAPLTVVNTPGFDLPQTGEIWLILLPIIGTAVCVTAILALTGRNRKKNAA